MNTNTSGDEKMYYLSCITYTGHFFGGHYDNKFDAISMADYATRNHTAECAVVGDSDCNIVYTARAGS